MKRFDQGLGALGVLALFVALAIILGVGLPVIKLDAPLKVSDWLGFAGNMIAAVLAAVAATVAWIAAQRQIKHAAAQNSVVAYAALKDVLRGVEEELRANYKIGGGLRVIQAYLEACRLQTEPNEEFVQASAKEIDLYLKRVVDGIEELSGSASFPWGSPRERKMRAQFIAVSTKYQQDIRLKRLKSRGEYLSMKALEDMALNDLWKEACDASEQFSYVIVAERERIIALMDQQFAGFTKFS
jgi:hypothetical protein